MDSGQRIQPSEFASIDAISDPQISQDEKYVSYLLRSMGKTYIARIDLNDSGNPNKYEVSIRFSHPLGGGSSQLSADGEAIYFISGIGGISKLDFASEKVIIIYEGPGVSQISLGCHETKIAAVMFGDRVALFDLIGELPPQTISNRKRQLAQFEGLPSEVERFVSERPDFIFDVNLSQNSSHVVWHEWALPDMAWNASQIAFLDYSSPDNGILVCAGGDYYVAQPRFSNDGSKVGFLAECNEHLNLWIGDVHSWQAVQTVDEPFEHGSPPWGSGNRSFGFSPAGDRIFFSRNEGGFGRLVSYDVASRVIEDLGKAHHFGLDISAESLVAIRSGAKTPNVVVKYKTIGGKRLELARSHSERYHNLDLPEPRLYLAPHSKDFHGYLTDEVRDEFSLCDPLDIAYRLYRPDALGTVGLPTVISFHGGPTDQPLVTYSSRNVAFLQQGYQVVQFDYRGSTGWGKSFRQALSGSFGVGEIVDLLTVLSDLKSRELIGEQPIVLNGGSSGGYSALRSLCVTRNLFSGVIAEYPLIDLAVSASLTHRFESRYFDHLIGQLPDKHELYRSRSIDPNRIDDVPLLIMHGDADPVVSFAQVVDFVEKLQSQGKDVKFFLFEGQGHGFSDPKVIEREYLAYEEFLRGIRSKFTNRN